MFFRLNFTKGLSMVRRKKTNEIEKPINAFSEGVLNARRFCKPN